MCEARRLTGPEGKLMEWWTSHCAVTNQGKCHGTGKAVQRHADRGSFHFSSHPFTRGPPKVTGPRSEGSDTNVQNYAVSNNLFASYFATV